MFSRLPNPPVFPPDPTDVYLGDLMPACMEYFQTECSMGWIRTPSKVWSSATESWGSPNLLIALTMARRIAIADGIDESGITIDHNTNCLGKC